MGLKSKGAAEAFERIGKDLSALNMFVCRVCQSHSVPMTSVLMYGRVLLCVVGFLCVTWVHQLDLSSSKQA